MTENKAVVDHYSHSHLLDAIRDGVRGIGKTPETVAIDDLAPVDEFHIGGRQTTEDFIGQLGLNAGDRVLDVGCGIGGTSRFVADRFGCRVSGIDLTPQYIDVGTALCSWVGLADQIDLHQGSALATNFEAATFDAAFMLHVGMNIEDKASLCAEIHRILRPGGVFGIFDVMRTGDEPIVYPVPWATVADTSALATPLEYREALSGAGFEITGQRDRAGYAAKFFENLQKRATASAGPPPLGLHILMGKSAPTKVRNMIENVAAGRISPVEMIARKAP